jgi:electron transfer flavoprotein beta subunit
MKDILAAGKKPVADYQQSDVTSTKPEPSTAVESLLAPPQVDRQLKILEGDTSEVVAAFIDLVASDLR